MLKFEGSYHGLVFAKEWNELHEGGDTLGQSLQMNNVGEREFTALVKAAKVHDAATSGWHADARSRATRALEDHDDVADIRARAARHAERRGDPTRDGALQGRVIRP